MNLQPKACVLAVGTELTTGQITNRNAAWISTELVSLGIDVLIHETVPDDRELILSALDHCVQTGSLLFVTGGLGPTSDDFTREVISDWLKLPLEFSEAVWKKVEKRLTDLGIPVAESNKRQCYFPKTSEIIPNPAGTAAAFSVFDSTRGLKIWILPGPPSEVSAVWEEGIKSSLETLFPKSSPLKLYTWQCMGKSEAEFGEITEKALLGSGLKTGYRAHRPYVEIKVWCEEKEVALKLKWIHQLEEILAPWIFTKQGEDLAETLLLRLERSENVEIIDSASGGLLTERLGVLLREPKYKVQAESITMGVEWAFSAVPEDWVAHILTHSDEETLTLAFGGITADGRGTIGLREGSRVFQLSIESPYRSMELMARIRPYLIEIALKQWCEWLNISTT